MIRQTRGARDVAGVDEVGNALDSPFVCARTFFDIRLHEKLAIRFEEPHHVVEERVPYHQALLMTLLPPRVGKAKKDTANGLRRQDAR